MACFLHSKGPEVENETLRSVLARHARVRMCDPGYLRVPCQETGDGGVAVRMIRRRSRVLSSPPDWEGTLFALIALELEVVETAPPSWVIR